MAAVAAAPLLDLAALPAPGPAPRGGSDTLRCAETMVPYEVGRLAITPEDFARVVVEHVAASGAAGGLAVRLGRMDPDDDLLHAVEALCALGLDEDVAWVVFAHWVNVRLDGAHDVGVTAVLAPLVSALAPALVLSAIQTLDHWRQAPSPLPGGDGPSSRLQRLRRALIR
jgi:hypothetical protein